MKIIPSVFWMLLICCSFPVWSQTEVNEVTESTEVEVEKKPEPQEEVVEIKDKKYVTDKLRLSLYKQADSSSGTVQL